MGSLATFIFAAVMGEHASDGVAVVAVGGGTSAAAAAAAAAGAAGVAAGVDAPPRGNADDDIDDPTWEPKKRAGRGPKK